MGDLNRIVSSQAIEITDGASLAADLSASAPSGTESALIVRNIPSGTQAVAGTVTAVPTGTQVVSGTITSTVSNFPSTQVVGGTVTALTSGTQAVTGTVTVGNFPATQTIAGTVTSIGTVTIVPTGTQAVSGTVTHVPSGTQVVSGTITSTVSNFPTVQTVAGTVTSTGTVTIVPSGTQAVSGTITSTVSNFPATQPVSGTVTIVPSGTQAVSGTISVSDPDLPDPIQKVFTSSVVAQTGIAAPGVGLTLHITGLHGSNSGATGTLIDFRNGVGSANNKYSFFMAPSGGGFSVNLTKPWELTVNTLLEIGCSASTASAYITVNYYIG